MMQDVSADTQAVVADTPYAVLVFFRGYAVLCSVCHNRSSCAATDSACMRMHQLIPATSRNTARSTEFEKAADFATILTVNLMDVPSLGRMHEGFFEAEDVAHADVSPARFMPPLQCSCGAIQCRACGPHVLINPYSWRLSCDLCRRSRPW